MDRKRISLLTILVLILIIISNVTAFATAAPKELNVAVYPNEPLLSYRDGKAEGFIVDLLDEVAKEENWDVSYKFYTSVRGLLR